MQTNRIEQGTQKQTHQLWPPDSDKEAKSIHWRKGSLLNRAGETEYTPGEQSKLIPISTLYKNRCKSLLGIRIGKDFLISRTARQYKASARQST